MIRDLDRLQHILESIQYIEESLEDDPQLSKQKTVDALFYRLQVIGEASRHISPSYYEQFSDIPWHRIIATRNYLVHEYFKIHMNKIISAIDDLPRIKIRIEEIIRQLTSNQ